jgi:aryl-alcohol dehydrogenase-like predicted oxidoreductase
MDRRDFLKAGTVAAGLAATNIAGAAGDAPPIPKRRLGKTGVDLSIIALGGIVVTDTTPEFASKIVGEAYDRGINYFDVAPSYGNAQTRLGPALEPYRKKVFLACKTGERTKAGAARELDESLRLLRTDHVDLYQLHHLTTLQEVDQVFGPDGAMETFQAAKAAGKIRFLGFSAHSVEAALAALDRFDFDTILFPINFVLFSQAKFGPQVLERAKQKGMGILALKGMAKTAWPKGSGRHAQPKCWYEPADLPDEAALALRWTLSQPITAAVPPGDEAYFRRAMDVAQHFEPIRPDEEKALLAKAEGVQPIFKLGTT